MLYIPAAGAEGASRRGTIDIVERDPRVTAGSTARPEWGAIVEWAHELAAIVAREQPNEHVAVLVPDPSAGGLRLAAQVWGAGEDTGAVRVGEWLVPYEESVCGRVFRTAVASLCSDVTFDADYRAFPGGRARSSLTVPIGPPGAVIGVINVEAPWVGAFSIRDHDRLIDRAAESVESYPLARPA
jgi:hypothetical protein